MSDFFKDGTKWDIHKQSSSAILTSWLAKSDLLGSRLLLASLNGCPLSFLKMSSMASVTTVCFSDDW